MPKKATKQSADVVAGIDAKIQSVITDIDAQIGKLEDKKAALLRLFGAPAAKTKRRGRPKGSKNVAKNVAKKAAVKKAGKKRVFSAETKRKLKEAAKARWAKVKAEKAKAEKK